ncbi:MAG: hypothetical protein DSY77_14840 [Bacteroidetes bacterium]|nr:MAG: hypothetical protein DSY77_14840 [Bacteroidota bacterium]
MSHKDRLNQLGSVLNLLPCEELKFYTVQNSELTFDQAVFLILRVLEVKGNIDVCDWSMNAHQVRLEENLNLSNLVNYPHVDDFHVDDFHAVGCDHENDDELDSPYQYYAHADDAHAGMHYAPMRTAIRLTVERLLFV